MDTRHEPRRARRCSRPLKRQVAALFGGIAGLGKALGISSQSVSKWPEMLTKRQANESLGAAIRAGKYRIIRKRCPDAPVDDPFEDW